VKVIQEVQNALKLIEELEAKLTDAVTESYHERWAIADRADGKVTRELAEAREIVDIVHLLPVQVGTLRLRLANAMDRIQQLQ